MDQAGARPRLATLDLVHPKPADAKAVGETRLIEAKRPAPVFDQRSNVSGRPEGDAGHVFDRLLCRKQAIDDYSALLPRPFRLFQRPSDDFALHGGEAGVDGGGGGGGIVGGDWFCRGEEL